MWCQLPRETPESQKNEEEGVLPRRPWPLSIGLFDALERPLRITFEGVRNAYGTPRTCDGVRPIRVS